IILQPEMCNQLFSSQMAQSILELHKLYEQVMLGVKLRRGHRAFEVEAEPFLHAAHPGTLCEIHKQSEIEHYRSGQDRIAAEKIDLDLHRITELTKDVYIVPALFVVAARRIVVYPHQMREIAVEFGIHFGLKDIFEHRQLRLFFGLERFGIVQDLSVPV